MSDRLVRLKEINLGYLCGGSALDSVHYSALENLLCQRRHLDYENCVLFGGFHLLLRHDSLILYNCNRP